MHILTLYKVFAFRAPARLGPLGVLAVLAASAVRPAGGAPPALEAVGGRLYRAHCLRCHDADGTGRGARDGMPEIPDFTGPSWQKGRSDAQLVVSILEGKGARMPPFAGKVTRDQARALAAYIRAFGPAPARPAAVSRAAPPSPAGRLYRAHCLRCHDADGTGSPLEGRRHEPPDFTSCRWQKGRSDAQLVVSILEGKGARMPPFAGKVTRDQARALAAFVRTFALTQTKTADREEDNFEERFRQLEEEFQQLRKQFRALSRGKARKR